MSNAYVQSNFARNPDSDYQTIDRRCLVGLLDCWSVPGAVWEACAPNGSALADQMQDRGYQVARGSDALTDEAPKGCRSLVTNPPYDVPLCDNIVRRGAELVASGDLTLAAYLLRTQWDHGKRRRDLLTREFFYAGEVKLCFRPWWSEDRSKQPIHSYIWLVFDRRHFGEPVIRYAYDQTGMFGDVA